MAEKDRYEHVRVVDLVPGDVIEMGGRKAIFIAETQHPIWSTMRLVIWQLQDGSWSFDALSWQQVVGDQIASRLDPDRIPRLKAALLHPSQADGGDWRSMP